MQIELLESRIRITPETRDEAIRANKFTGSFDTVTDPEGYGLFLKERHALYLELRKGTQSFVPAKAETAALDPYVYRLMEWVPAFDGWPKPVDFTECFGQFEHGRILRSAVMRADNILEVDAIVKLYSEPKEDPEKVAADKLRVGIEEKLLHRPPVPEYIETANGLYKRNPKYATGFQNPIRKEIPPYGGDAVWSVLFNAWLRDVATPGQRDVIATLRHYDGHDGPAIGLKDYTAYVTNEKGTCNYDGKGLMVSVLKPGEFRELLQGA